MSLRTLNLRAQEGFTTVVLMGVLMVGGLMIAAGFAAVDPDIGLSRTDQDQKEAYAAAEAGINYYLYHLGQDNNWYLKCDGVPAPDPLDPAGNPVDQVWTGSAATPPSGINFRAIPGERAQYNLELLPAKGYSACIANKQETMIDPSTGAFRIRATGRVKKLNGPGYVTRSVVVTLRRKSFIDFLYFTAFETQDPYAYADPDDQAWAQTNCADKYRPQRNSNCTEIRFVDDDVVSGPLHSNDSILTCGPPTFGRNSNDAIELGGNTPGWTNVCNSSPPNFAGTKVWPATILEMPPTNKELKNLAATGYSYSGRTQITLSGGSMTVTNNNLNPKTQTKTLPTNGVIYVDGTSCAAGYARKQTYSNPSTCGDVYVQGNYSQDLTIAASNDVIITDDLTRNSAGLLMGVVADNFVRVYHPVRNWSNNDTNCDNTPSSSTTGTYNSLPGPGTITIQSAVLALNHSFIVDNYYCGSPTGTLNVDGAIAQRYRGPVGTGSSSSIASGYLKNYTYNDRLRYREPPFFIDPVQSAWQIVRQNEQVPAPH